MKAWIHENMVWLGGLWVALNMWVVYGRKR